MRYVVNKYLSSLCRIYLFFKIQLFFSTIHLIVIRVGKKPHLKENVSMKINRNLVSQFKSDLVEFLKIQNKTDFKMRDFFDEHEGVYFFFHNDKQLDDNKEIELFVTNKMGEYFFSNSIFNVCFTEDFVFTDWSKIEPSLITEA